MKKSEEKKMDKEERSPNVNTTPTRSNFNENNFTFLSYHDSSPGSPHSSDYEYVSPGDVSHSWVRRLFGDMFNKNKKSYQVIDDNYDDAEYGHQSSSSASMFPLGMGRSTRISDNGNNETQPLVGTSSSYEIDNTYQLPPTSHLVHEDDSPIGRAPPVMISSNRTNEHRWDHIDDLDKFFTRVYEYHQGGGFMCISISKILSLFQFLFIVTFSTFFLQCVDYDVLFANKNTTSTGQAMIGKRHFGDAIVSQCASHLHPLVVVSILVAAIFWITRVIKTAYYLLELHEIQLFYNSALSILDAQLSNLSWHSVVKRICEVQPRLKLMIHTEKLTTIDLYHRILRFKNYFVAMVNRRLLPPVLSVPFLGNIPYLPNGLKMNLKRILFLSSSSPFSGPYLKEEYKDRDNLDMLTTQMEKNVTLYGLFNLVFFPLIFLYQILYSFFTLSELIRRRSDALGMRMYSNYGRYRVRHLNELDHELTSRLNRSHAYANAYLNQFFSPLMNIVAKHIAFMAGALIGVLTVLAAWDEDVLQIEHVLTVIAVCGGILIACHGLIVDENLVWQPEVLLTHVTSELHYIPSEWTNNAHTDKVRHEFEQLFQLKWMFLLQELSSPLLTPFILLFWVRPQCRSLVSFFHDHTESVKNLGDVCSFALLDVKKHGDPNWYIAEEDEGDEGDDRRRGSASDSCMRALDGKTEMSVLQFATTNPEWQPPPASAAFLARFRQKIEEDALHMGDNSPNRQPNILQQSVLSLMPSIRRPGALPNALLLGDNVNRIEGVVEPIRRGSGHTLLSTLHSAHPEAAMSFSQSLRESGVNMDTAGADMRVQTLFLRGIHDKSMLQSRRSQHGGANIGRSYGGAGGGSRSMFGVPDMSHLQDSYMSQEESVHRGRNQMTSLPMPLSETVDEIREEHHEEDDERPPDFFSSA